MAIESHDHRTVVAQGLEGTSGDHRVPPPPIKAGSLQQVEQVGVHVGLEYLQRRRLHKMTLTVSKIEPVPFL